MSDKSKIEWTDATWNPVRGCTKVSAGCKNCYAETFAERWRGVPGHAYEQGFDLRAVPEKLTEPLKWREPRRVFVNSMSDLFHEKLPDEFIARVFAVMALCPQHTFQVLTKRADRMRAFMNRECSIIGMKTDERVWKWAASLDPKRFTNLYRPRLNGIGQWPLPNVWMGVSVENQELADKRIPLLLETPAAVRFLSCEPLLGGIDLSIVPRPDHFNYQPRGWDNWWPRHIHWVIVGGESGRNARPCYLGSVKKLVDQCQAARVPVFVKQLGSIPMHRVHEPLGTDPRSGVEPYRVKHPKGGDPTEWPPALRVQEFPEGVAGRIG